MNSFTMIFCYYYFKLIKNYLNFILTIYLPFGVKDLCWQARLVLGKKDMGDFPEKSPFLFFFQKVSLFMFFSNDAPCLNAKNTSNQPQWYFSSQSRGHPMDRPSGWTGLQSRMVQSIWSAEQFSYPNGEKKLAYYSFGSPQQKHCKAYLKTP